MIKVATKPVKHVSAKHVPSLMKSSKLLECLFILQVVAQKSPLNPTAIMSEFKFKRSLLKDCLELLVTQNLIIEETGYSNKMICGITEGGYNVLKFFKLDLPIKIPSTFQC